MNNFYTNLTFLLDEFAPYKKVSNKEYRLNFKPWISTEILNLMKQRDKLLKNFSQENDPTKKKTLHTAYKQLRNLVTQKKRLSNSLCYTSYFEENREKSSVIWKGIRNLVNVKSSNKTHFKLLDNDKLISDQKKIANKFNNYFVNVGINIDKQIPKTNGDFRNYFLRLIVALNETLCLLQGKPTSYLTDN